MIRKALVLASHKPQKSGHLNILIFLNTLCGWMFAAKLNASRKIFSFISMHKNLRYNFGNKNAITYMARNLEAYGVYSIWSTKGQGDEHECHSVCILRWWKQPCESEKRKTFGFLSLSLLCWLPLKCTRPPCLPTSENRVIIYRYYFSAV